MSGEYLVMNRGPTLLQDEKKEASWSFATKIKGDGLDCKKIVHGEEEVRIFIEAHAEVIPSKEIMIGRLKKADHPA